jgi:hypothetical protein
MDSLAEKGLINDERQPLLKRKVKRPKKDTTAVKVRRV